MRRDRELFLRTEGCHETAWESPESTMKIVFRLKSPWAITITRNEPVAS